MAGQVSDQPGELVVGDPGAEPADLVRGAVEKSLPNGLRWQPEQRLVVLVGHLTDPGAQ